jgi:hypothetical protein
VDNDVDQALVARYRAGDKDAFAELVIRYQRPIYNAAFWILRQCGRCPRRRPGRFPEGCRALR